MTDNDTKPLFDVDRNDPDRTDLETVVPNSPSESAFSEIKTHQKDTSATTASSTLYGHSQSSNVDFMYTNQQQPEGKTRRSFLTNRKLKSFIYQWKWPLILFTIWLTMGIVMLIYRKEFLQLLETMSYKLSEMGQSGYFLMASLIFASAFPPMIGYGLYQTLSGYTFGFLIGFPVSYFSALAGAIVCFLLSRTFFKNRVAHMLSQYPNLEAAVKAAEKKGFKLFLLIRLSPYPFNMLNVLFAATHLPLSHFAAGTAISLLKIALHVYVGATLTSFIKHVLGKDDDLMTESELRAEKIKYVFVGMSALLGMGVMVYMYRVVKTAVAETVTLESANSVNAEEELSFLHDDDTDEDDDEETRIGSSSSKQNMKKLDHDSSITRASIETWADWGDELDSSQTTDAIPMKRRA